jgi:hypothetical protein
MPRIVTTVHDPVALAATCRRLSLDPPTQRAVQLDAEEVSGWVVHLPGLIFPIVCDTLSGLIAYHARDNAFHRYARIMRFLERYYHLRAQLRRGEQSCGIRNYHHAEPPRQASHVAGMRQVRFRVPAVRNLVASK